MVPKTTRTMASCKNFIFCALSVFFLFSNSAFAQNKSSELDRLFTYYNENGMFNGIVLAAENGKIIYKKAFGYSYFENKIPLDSSSVFSIGSLTKSYTALAIMMLNEQGLLSYEEKLIDFFPEFPDYAKPITIRHLLTHTSGLVDIINDLDLLDKAADITDTISLDSLICQPALKFESGKKYSYCNSGYLLLALIIEKVTGQTYGEFLEKNIFKPLGMNHTYVLDESLTNIPNRVNSYEDFWIKNDNDLHLKANGFGNIYSTADDQFLFDQALYTDKLISQKSLQVAYDTTGLIDRRKYVYGFGWKIQLDPPGRIVYHNGALAGFRAQLWRDLNNKNTLITLANNTWLSKVPDILSAAENIMLDKPFALGKISAEELFYENWYFKGSDAALKKLQVVTTNDSSHYYIHPWEINGIGYFFLNKNEYRQSIEIFKYAVRLFPDDHNLWDSLGEAYMKAGNKPEAIKNYKKALELNPDSETSKKALQVLEKK